MALAYLAIEEFRAVSPSAPSKTAAGWKRRVLQAAYAARRRSYTLAKSYYQLARALDTGYVLGNPDLPVGTPITLRALREHFISLIEHTAQLGLGETGLGSPEDQWLEQVLAVVLDPKNPRTRAFQATDLSEILEQLTKAMGADNPGLRKDSFAWPTDVDFDRFSETIGKKLDTDVIEALEAKIAKAAEVNSKPDVAKRKAADDHQKSGSRGAGLVDWSAVQAGRGAIAYAGRRDSRVKLVGRGTSNNPCHFCAMLASRGFVYTSDRSAGFNSQGVSEWHHNCHCYPIVRWDDKATEPAIMAEFKQAWPRVTRGYSGAAAIRVWRKWIAGRALAMQTNDSLEE